MMAQEKQELPIVVDTKWTAVDGLRLRYAEAGRRNGPDILLLLPWPGGLQMLEPVWSIMIAMRRVVAVELPGFGIGEGSRLPMTPRIIMAFIIKIIEAFRPRHPHLMAYDKVEACASLTSVYYPGAVESIILSKSGIYNARKLDGEQSVPQEDRRDIEAWSEVASKLKQIVTPVLIITDAEGTADNDQVRMLRAGLPRCRSVDVSQDCSSASGETPLCCQLLDVWIDGKYRSDFKKAAFGLSETISGL